MARVPLIIEPDEDDPDCATVLVNGSIAGRPYQFMIDTGAARTDVITDDYLMNLPSHAQHRSSGVIGTRSEDLVLLTDLTVGPLTELCQESWTVPRGVAGQAAVRNWCWVRA